MKMAATLPDNVLQEIDRLARRLKRPRRARFGEAVTGSLRRARETVVDALVGLACSPVVVSPP
ncbi:MAG TPA: hypothetical protein VH880_04100 [Anaeromyxobacteraceae bacterium]